MAIQTGQVNSRVSTNLKLRSQPNTTSQILADLTRGTRFEILAQVTGSSYSPGSRTDWYEIKFSGQRGYVAAYYVDIVGTRDGDRQRIIDAINRVNAEQWYYKARDITGDRRKETFCNWFVADVLYQLGIELPRYNASAGAYPTPHPVYGNNPPHKPYSAEQLFNFFNSGGNGNWRKVTVSEAVSKAQNGKVVLASYSGATRIQGHVAIVRPNSSTSNIRVAQAGATSSNDISFNSGFGSHATEAEFFTYA